MQTQRVRVGSNDFIQLTTDELFNEEIRIDSTILCPCGSDVVTEIVYFTTIPNCPATVQVRHGANRRRFSVGTPNEITVAKLDERITMVSRSDNCDGKELVDRRSLSVVEVDPVF